MNISKHTYLERIYLIKIQRRILTFCIFACALLSGVTASATISFQIYISRPGDVATNLTESDLKIEDFEGANAGTAWANGGYDSDVGTYTGTGVSTIRDDNEYSSENGGQYLGIDYEGEVRLELDQPVHYLGFAWPAGDAENEVTVFSNGIALFTLETADIINFLAASNTITALNGEEYDTDDYYGKPKFKKGELEKKSKRDNNIEPYAYIHIVGVGTGNVFDEVSFAHQRTDGGEFETDNHAILTSSTPVIDTNSDWVFTYNSEDLIPEPSTYAFLAGLAVFAGVVVRRKR